MYSLISFIMAHYGSPVFILVCAEDFRNSLSRVDLRNLERSPGFYCLVALLEVRDFLLLRCLRAEFAHPIWIQRSSVG